MVNFSKKLQIALALLGRAVLFSLKNLRVLINTKLHQKLCSYLYLYAYYTYGHARIIVNLRNAFLSKSNSILFRFLSLPNE